MVLLPRKIQNILKPGMGEKPALLVKPSAVLRTNNTPARTGRLNQSVPRVRTNVRKTSQLTIPVTLKKQSTAQDRKRHPRPGGFQELPQCRETNLSTCLLGNKQPCLCEKCA